MSHYDFLSNKTFALSTLITLLSDILRAHCRDTEHIASAQQMRLLYAASKEHGGVYFATGESVENGTVHTYTTKDGYTASARLDTDMFAERADFYLKFTVTLPDGERVAVDIQYEINSDCIMRSLEEWKAGELVERITQKLDWGMEPI